MTVRQIWHLARVPFYKNPRFVVGCRCKTAVQQTFGGYGGLPPSWLQTPPTALTLVFFSPLASSRYMQKTNPLRGQIAAVQVKFPFVES